MTTKLAPQYYETNCILCGKPQYASVEEIICHDCEQTSAPVDEILRLRADNAKLREALANLEAAASALDRNYPLIAEMTVEARRALEETSHE